LSNSYNLHGVFFIIVYCQYKCGSSNWVSVSSDVIFARACGVTPSTQVICTVMAVVGGDASQEVSQTIQTGNTGTSNYKLKFLNMWLAEF